MEHPLSRSASWLNSVLEASLSGVLAFEPLPGASGEPAEYRATFANRAADELIGTVPERVVGNTLGNMFPNDAILRVHFDRVVVRGEAQRFEFEHFNPARPGAGRTWFDASVNRLDGGVVMSFNDVTATRQVQAQAEKTIARLHSILDGSPAAIGLLEAVRDPESSGRIADFTIVSLNEQFCSLMKYEPADLIGRRFKKLFKRSLTAKLYDRFVRVVQTGVPLHEELRLERGPLLGWFDLTAVRQGDGLTITVLDVTDYREAEETARQTARMLETVLDRAQAGVTGHHAVRNTNGEIEDFRVVAINEASTELFARVNPDLRGQALTGWRLSRFFPQAWDLGLFDRFVHVVETGEPVRYERTYPTEAGELWFDVSAVKENDGLILTFVDITRSKEAELNAEATAELLGGVFDASPWAIVYLAPDYDANGDVVDFIFQLANAKSEEIGQRPLPNLLGGRMLEMYPRIRDLGLFEEYVRVLETGKPFEREVFFEQGDIAAWSHITAVKQGEGLVLTYSDVTARKLAELQNEESLRLLQGVLASAPTAIFWLEAVRDAENPGRIVDFSFALFNAHTVGLTHRSAADLHAQRLRHLFPHLENTGLFDDYVRVVKTGEPLQRDVFYDWDGISGWFNVQAARHDDGVVVQVLDITDRMGAELALREETRRLREAQTLGRVGSFEWNAGEEFTAWSDELYRIMGLEPQSVPITIEMTDRWVHPDDWPAMAERKEQSLQTPGEYVSEHRLIRPDGAERWVNHRFESLADPEDPAGRVVRVRGTVQDVTERKQAEQEVLRLKDELAQHAEDRYQTLFATMDQGFCLLEAVATAAGQPGDFRYLSVNPAFGRHTGLGNVVGKTIREVVPDAEPELLDAYAEVARTGRHRHLEAYVRALDLWMEAEVFPAPEPGQIAVLLTNVTARKKTEERLRLAAEMDAFRANLSDALRPLADPLLIQQTALQFAAEQLGLDRLLYNEIDADVTTYTTRTCYVREGFTAYGGAHPMGPFTESVRALQEGITKVVYDVETDESFTPEEKRICAGIGVRAFVVVPLLKEGRWVLNLVAHSGRPRPWPPQELSLLEETAERTWAAVERARAEEALRESEEKFRTLFNSIDEGYCLIETIFDEAGKAVDFRYLETNPVFEQQTGQVNIAGKRASETSPHTEAVWFESLGDVARTGTPLRFENFHADTGRWYAGYAARVGGAGSALLTLVFADITERKRREANLAFLADITGDSARLTSEEAIVHSVGERLAMHLHLGGISFSEVDEAHESVTVKYNWNAADVPQIVGTFRFAEYMTEEFADTMRAGKTWVVNDTQHDERTDAAATAALGVGAIINVPYFRQGGWEGCFTAMSRAARAWTDDEIALIEEVTNRVFPRLERARAEAALRQSEERLRLAIDVAEMGTWEWYLNTNEVYWNEHHFTQFGMEPRPNPLVADDFFSHLHPDDRDRVERQLRQAIAERSVFDAEFRAVPETGGTRWMNGYGRVTEAVAGQPARMSGVMLDITERKRAEEQLRDFAAQLEQQVAERTADVVKNRTLLQQTEAVAEMGSWAYTPATGVFEWSEGMYRLFGLEPGTPVQPETYLDFTVGADQAVAARIVDFLNYLNGHELEEQFRIQTTEGEKTVRIKATVQRNAAGEPERALGVDIDITAQVQAERQLAATAETLRTILDAAQAGIALLKAVREPERTGPIADFVVLSTNHLAAEFNGIPVEHTLGRRCSELFPYYKTTGLFDRYVEVVETGQQQRFEARNEGFGPVEWFDVSLGKHGDGLVVTFSDISRLKRLQLQHQAQATMLEGILDSSANSLGVYDALRDEQGQIVDFRVRLFNPAALQSAGLRWADVEGKTLLQLSPYSKEVGIFHAAVEVVETGQSQQLTRDYPHVGKSFSIALSRFNHDGLIVGAVDITELRKAQRHQEELLDDLRKSNLNLEQFAYVTSHDLQEPLRKIQSFGNMLAKRLGDRLDPTEVDLIHRMQDAATRMKTLIEDLLTFSRLSSKKEAFRWLHLDRLVREVLGDLESTIQEKNARVHVGPLPRLKGDAMQWRQLLQNLLSNALKFTRAGVVPEVRVEARAVSTTDCPGVAGLRASQTYWELTVADNGIGFDDQYREKIFDMFQRLHGRAEYSGTGIGLAIAKKVAEQHGGCVSAHGVPGQGATFRVYVPTTPTPPEAPDRGD